MKDYFKNIIENFGNLKVLVIGDAILDTYVKGTSDRLCREAPVPVITVQEEESHCGGAANTAINVSALGAQTYFLSAVGQDDCGMTLKRLLNELHVDTKNMILSTDRKTLCKKRITVSSNILLRVDEGETQVLPSEIETDLIAKLEKLYKKADAVILSDYGYGIITDQLIKTLIRLNSRSPKPVIADAKNLDRFKNLHPMAVKPNYEETLHLLELPKVASTERVSQVLNNGKKLLELSGAQYVAATIDVEGSILFERNKKPYRILTTPKDNKRAIGAGDTFISAFALALCSGAGAAKAAEIASAAAAIVLQKEGTVVCNREELKAYLNEIPKYIASAEDLKKRVSELKKEGKRIVFTNGCFDILHSGHVNLIHHAKQLGDVLIVGINGDASIRRLKGKERPINGLQDRITVLAGLNDVDILTSFEEDSPVELIKVVKPDVFVKGGDYTADSIPEAPLVKSLGGEVQIISFVKNRSTTLLIEKIREKTMSKVKSPYKYANATGLE